MVYRLHKYFSWTAQYAPTHRLKLGSSYFPLSLPSLPLPTKRLPRPSGPSAKLPFQAGPQACFLGVGRDMPGQCAFWGVGRDMPGQARSER
eukprot:1136864-Pelagomonas_calceolata.AAC.5